MRVGALGGAGGAVWAVGARRSWMAGVIVGFFVVVAVVLLLCCCCVLLLCDAV